MTTASQDYIITDIEQAQVTDYIMGLLNQAIKLGTYEIIQDTFWVINAYGEQEFHSVSVADTGQVVVFFFGTMPMTWKQAEQYILSLIR